MWWDRSSDAEYCPPLFVRCDGQDGGTGDCFHFQADGLVGLAREIDRTSLPFHPGT